MVAEVIQSTTITALIVSEAFAKAQLIKLLDLKSIAIVRFAH